MLTCIACSKKLEDEGDNGLPRGTPSNKDGVKSLTAQIKDMALKFSGAYRQCKPCMGPSGSIIGAGAGAGGYHRGLRPPPYGGFHRKTRFHEQGNSSSFTQPIWDHHPLEAMSPNPRVVSSAGERTPTDPELDTNSSRSGNAVIVEDDEAKEWMAQVEPGVHITFVSLPHGGNDLKRIRFSREMFNKWEAQRWWGENYDRIMELYNVQRFNRHALPTPPRSEDERDMHSMMGSARESPATPSLGRERMQRNQCRPAIECGQQVQGSMAGMPNMVAKLETSSVDASRTTTSSRDENSVSISNASDQEAEWVEQDEPGVYITLRALADGTRELRRVRFSRERFGEVHAKLWWEQNRERIQEQYL